MSELKAYVKPLKTNMFGKTIVGQSYYLKSEADKVIARHKRKRCLAMAEWCEATELWCYQAANTLPIGFRATLYGKPVMIEPRRLFKRSERLDNWVNRWLALAEEPTWERFLQLIHKEAK